MTVLHESVRHGSLIAFESIAGDPTTVEIVDVNDDRWTERCEGCDGSGYHVSVWHGRLAGPCRVCWGTGRAFFAFAVEESRAIYVPVDVAVRDAHELMWGIPWTREIPPAVYHGPLGPRGVAAQDRLNERADRAHPTQ